MKILHIIPSMNPKQGGPPQGVRNYTYGLIGKDIYRDVICFDSPEDAEQWQAEGLRIIALGNVNNKLQYHPQLKPWLESNIEYYNAIIIHGLWLYHSYATINVVNKLKSKGFKVPKVFVMPHGMLDPWFQKDKSRRLKSIRNSIYWHLFEKKVINGADGLFFTCQDELELAKTTFNGYKPKKTINVGYGIAPPSVYTEEMKNAFKKQYPLSKTKPYVLFLSRIHPKKGIDLLLEAYEKILKSNKNYSIPIPELVIAGPGIETVYGKDMLQKINESSLLKEYVHFVGMVSGDAKWGALYGCEAFVLPSHQENFGIAVAEALACGKPVLISNQVNIWKEIDSVGAGIINEDTIQGTFKSLEKFLSMPKSEFDHMKIQAFLAYEQFFEVRNAAQQLLGAIQ